MKRMRLLAAGPKSDWPDALVEGQLAGPWAGADRGALRLLALGQTPVMAVGDFDSLTEEEAQVVLPQIDHVFRSIPEKDYTDTERLVREVEEMYHPDEIEIYGATGGRIDQMLSNLFIFATPELQEIATKVRLIDRRNDIRFYLPGEHAITHVPGMKYVCFMPLTPVEELDLMDEKYPLKWSGNPYAWSSNEFTSEVNHFRFKTGVVAVIQSRD
ncbi:thiamine diphosphokinase [Weissella tructae]|uniref:Thiamine diphosphokinase n=2 Tax=Weissella TaxID=46255 RepID=A0A075TYG5_9LACO|nr:MULTISPECIES: thiamine diphosphokinase [Weissella]AIG65265.1 ThiN protein [Weissella tructae]AIM62578.1 ThiN protein [Weissella ceti]ELA07667.1 thiamine pyrophosphokinase [Weissella ceti NC36]QVV91646.1 thiamine diphosphokinase [Weissella tructae]